MSTSLKIWLAGQLWTLGERLVVRATETDLDRAIERLNASVKRLERKRTEAK